MWGKGEFNKESRLSVIGGFSLVELLTALSILAIMAALLVPVVGGMVQRSKQTSGQGIMRGIWQAVNLYVLEHDGALPGRLWPGQVAEYNPDREGRLVDVLAPYMGYHTNALGIVDDFAPPAFWDAVESGQEGSTRVYVLRDVVDLSSGLAGRPPPGPPGSGPGGGMPPPPKGVYRPFGAQAAALPPRIAEDHPDGIPGMPMGVVQMLFPSEWMLSDVDQQHEAVQGKGWLSNTVEQPYHGESRNTLYFDGRVDVVAVE